MSEPDMLDVGYRVEASIRSREQKLESERQSKVDWIEHARPLLERLAKVYESAGLPTTLEADPAGHRIMAYSCVGAPGWVLRHIATGEYMGTAESSRVFGNALSISEDGVVRAVADYLTNVRLAEHDLEIPPPVLPLVIKVEGGTKP